MPDFKMSFHSATGRRIVEVWEGRDFICAIYPGKEARSFTIVSKFSLDANVVPDAAAAGLNSYSVTIGDYLNK